MYCVCWNKWDRPKINWCQRARVNNNAMTLLYVNTDACTDCILFPMNICCNLPLTVLHQPPTQETQNAAKLLRCSANGSQSLRLLLENRWHEEIIYCVYKVVQNIVDMSTQMSSLSRICKLCAQHNTPSTIDSWGVTCCQLLCICICESTETSYFHICLAWAYYWQGLLLYV